MDDSGLQLNCENRYDDDNDDLLPTQIVDNRVLKGVTAYVEVRSANDNRSDAVKQVLIQLGATVVDKFTDDVTHVIFKEGSTRTKNKAKKKGKHLLSVLWVENCKLNQEHVSERMYPANVPEVSNNMFKKTKLKKLKSMQPKDFEEELANSAKRVARKRKKENMMNNLRGGDCTPSNSPYLGHILVQDTQPQSQEDGPVFTPIRLTIPETPPSMREKMKQLRLKRAAERESLYSNSEVEDEFDQRELNYKQLQKKLFNGVSISDDENISSSYQSTTDISSILSAADDNSDNGEKEDDDNDDNDDDDQHTHQSESNIPDQPEEVFNSSIRSESSVNNDILAIAKNINATLNSPSKRTSVFGMDSDENLASSQEIKACANVTVKVSRKTGKISKCEDLEVGKGNKNNSRNSDLDSSESKSNKKAAEEDKASDGEPKKRRRSSRRLSVKQAVDALDESHLLDLVPETIEEEEDPIPKPSKSNTDLNRSETGCDNDDTDLPNSEKNDKKSKKGRQRSSSNKRTSSVVNTSDVVIPEKQDGSEQNDCFKAREKRNSSSIGKRKSLPETETTNAEDQLNNDGEEKHNDSNEIDKVETKKSRGRNTRKKKLLSINDMYEQPSVLLEPSTCSQIDRPNLIEDSISTDKTSKKGKRRQSPRIKRNVKNDNNSDTVSSDKTLETDNKAIESKTRGRKRKTMETSEADNVNDITESNSRGRGRRKTKIQKTLVNDTHCEDKTLGAPSTDPIAKIQDVTTQLNLTKDNSLVCSIRETTLSLSMSAAYNDSNMPSFLTSQRKSIDEFNGSKRHRKKSKLVEKSVLTSIGESLSSESKRSETGASVMDETCNKKMKSFRSGSKLFRPSIVMTSLHTCEQDIVISVVKKLGGFIIAENVNETTTHVICGEPRRTLNVIRCVARGAWLLSKDWVISSLENGKWIDEHDYECTSSFPTCKVARLEKERCKGLYKQSIFRNMGPMYVSGKSRPSRPHLVQLIKLCGGQVIGVKEKASVYIGTDYHPGLTCVKTTWLLDCITEHAVKPMEEYFLDRPKRESSPEF